VDAFPCVCLVVRDQLLGRRGFVFKYVPVKNHGPGKDFTLFDESDGRRGVEQMGGCIIELPELDGVAMARIDRSGASFWSAVHSAAGEHVLPPLQRARLWLGRCFQAFGSVVDALAQRRDPSASSTLAEQSAANGSAN
jgi:hypothetical protein